VAQLFAYKVTSFLPIPCVLFVLIFSSEALAAKPVPPIKPSSLNAQARSSSEIDLNWNDDSSNELGFKVERSTNGGGFLQIAKVGANIKSFNDTGLSNSTNYTYRVMAYDKRTISLSSNSASAMTLAPSPAPSPTPSPSPGPTPVPTTGVIQVSDYGDGTASLANTQAACDAVAIGSTVILPPGIVSWSNSLNITKALTLQGAGAGTGGTKIVASGAMPNGFILITHLVTTGLVRITGIHFDALSPAPPWILKIWPANDIANLRIDHNVFKQGQTHIEVNGAKGVIDHNDHFNAVQAISFSAGTRAQADASWASLNAGSADALFIEDNRFITDAEYAMAYTQEQIATYNGGKLVVRHNQFNADNMSDELGNYTPFMAHGSADGGCGGAGYWESSSCQRRGQSVIEFYDNIESGKRIDFLYISRGSVNLVYNNAIVGTVLYNPRIILVEEEYFSDNWKIHRTAWPAEDQVHNTFIWNNTYRGYDFNQELYGSVETTPTNYECTGAGVPMSCCSGNGAGTCGNLSNPKLNPFLRLDRDYFLHAPCGASDLKDAFGNTCTQGMETFTGAKGASSTFPTDGTTYPTQGTMIFVPDVANAYYDYKPFTYPHPLVTSPAGAAL
jgi:hypothetical protein